MEGLLEKHMNEFLKKYPGATLSGFYFWEFLEAPLEELFKHTLKDSPGELQEMVL